MVAGNPAKFDANVTQKSYNVRKRVHAMGNAKKEVLPETVTGILCTCQLIILVN